MVWLLDHPNNWRISSHDISRQVREGRDAIRRCMNELADAGYLVINRTQIERGRWCTDMVLYERPVDNSTTEDGFPGLGATRGNATDNDETPGATEDGFPGLGFPGLGFPGPIRKTVKEDCPAEISRDGYAGAGEIVVITDEDLDAIGSARIRSDHRQQRQTKR